jgi:hypothetical protein
MKLLLLIFLVPFSALAGMMSYSVSPGIVKFETVTGSVKSFDLDFLNQGDNPLNIEIKVMNLTLDRQGVPVVSKISNQKAQWGRFVKVSDNKFKLEAKESKKINVLLNTPRSAYGGGYFAVVFNTSATDSKRKRKDAYNTMSVGSQMPVLFIGKILRAGYPKVQISQAVINKAPYTKDKPLKLRVLLKNKGTTHASVTGDVLLRHNGKVVERLMLESGSGLIFPDGERYYIATLDKFKKYANKKLQAEVRFSYPGGRVNKKITFKVK